jgi:hypothetical protein
MAIDYLKIFREGAKTKAKAPPAPKAAPDTQQSDAILHAQELKAEREAIQAEGCSSVLDWVNAVDGVPPEVLAKAHGELCDIIDREGEAAGERYLIRLGKKYHNRA